MSETAGVLLFLLSCLAALWSVAGLIRPRVVLWWAVSEKQTRGRAFAFSLLVALTLFFLAATFAWNIKWWVWLVDALCLGVLFCMTSLFTWSKKDLQQFMKAQEHEKKLRLTRTAYSQNSDAAYTIWPYRIRCSCPDWEERRAGHAGPFAVCKHLAKHYTFNKEDMPESLKKYADLISLFACEGKGVPPEGTFGLFGHTEDMGYLATGYEDTLPWVNVYTDYGPEQYGFNLESGRWAKDKEPSFAGQIAMHILNRRKSWTGQ